MYIREIEEERKKGEKEVKMKREGKITGGTLMMSVRIGKTNGITAMKTKDIKCQSNPEILAPLICSRSYLLQTSENFITEIPLNKSNVFRFTVQQ